LGRRQNCLASIFAIKLDLHRLRSNPPASALYVGCMESYAFLYRFRTTGHKVQGVIRAPARDDTNIAGFASNRPKVPRCCVYVWLHDLALAR